MLWLQIWNWLRREKGQDLTEYALLIALIVIVCIAAVGVLGQQIQATLQAVAGALAAHTP